MEKIFRCLVVNLVSIFLLLSFSNAQANAQYYLPGDANGDGKVDRLDYLIWLNHYGQSTTLGPATGDFDQNGKVDGLDYMILSKNDGKVTSLLILPLLLSPTRNASIGNTTVAKWKNNAKGVVTIYFDDSWPSHVDIAVPELNKRGLVGTFFLVPGHYGFQARESSWAQIGAAGVQELANHTMTHSGAKDYAEAEYEIGEAAKMIWSLRPPGASKIQGFARGGGTDWNITSAELAEIQAKYLAISRTSSYSYSSKDANSHNLQNLKNMVDQAITGQSRAGITFHCIHSVPGDSCSLTTNKADFLAYLDYLQSRVQSGDIWSAGWAASYMYERERSNATVKVISLTVARIEISFTSTLDPALYNEPLTLNTGVPSSWSSVRVTQGTSSKSYNAQNGKLVYDAVPGKGNVILESISLR